MSNDDRKRWRAEIKQQREAIRRLKLILPERRPGFDAMRRLHIENAIGTRREIIRDRTRALKGDAS